MVNLVRYELEKHFLKRSIIIVLLIFSIINSIKIDSVYREKSILGDATDSIWNEVYWELYNSFSGEMTLKKIEGLLAIQQPLEDETADLTASRATDNPNTYTGNVYSDYYLLTWCFVEPMEYSYMYQYRANDVVNKAQENMLFHESYGNDYLYKENEKIAQLFSGRVVDSFAYTEMYQYYLEYNFSVLLVLLLCLYGLVNVFVCEKETDMEVLLLTTVLGGIKTVSAKIISSVIFIVFVCTWFWLLDFIMFSFSFQSLQASTLPIYALKNFEYTPLNITLGQYAILSAGIKTLGVILIGLIILLISLKSKKSLLPFVVSLVFIASSVFWQEMLEGSGKVWEKIFNPFILVVNSTIFKKIEFINFFGIPISSYIVAIIFAFIACGVTSALILFFARKSTVLYKKVGLYDNSNV